MATGMDLLIFPTKCHCKKKIGLMVINSLLVLDLGFTSDDERVLKTISVDVDQYDKQTIT